MSVKYDGAAREEGFEAAAWYGEQQGGLQTRFLKKWRDAENRIGAHPEIHRCFEGELRKCRFEVFPYALIFRIRGDELQVLAVMHMSSRPGYWKARGENVKSLPLPTESSSAATGSLTPPPNSKPSAAVLSVCRERGVGEAGRWMLRRNS